MTRSPSDPVTITLPLRPMAAPRPRVTRYGTHNRESYTQFKAAIGLACRRHFPRPLEGPLGMRLLFQFRTPKSWSRKRRAAAFHHSIRPDADNLAKSILDGLNGIAFVDDAQISRLSVSKRWGESDLIEIEIRSINTKENDEKSKTDDE